jgi:hypothetical protein
MVILIAGMSWGHLGAPQLYRLTSYGRVIDFQNLQRVHRLLVLFQIGEAARYVKYSTSYLKYSPYLIGKYTFFWLGVPMILCMSEAMSLSLYGPGSAYCLRLSVFSYSMFNAQF